MDTKELARRYGLTDQAVRKFIRRHLSVLNSDGEHAQCSRSGWSVDDIGLKRLDDLRGYNEVAVEVVDEPDELAELKAENIRLMKMLLASQAEVIRLQRELELLIRKNQSPSFTSWLKSKFLR